MIKERVKEFFSFNRKRKVYTVLHRQLGDCIPDVRKYMRDREYDKYTNYVICDRNNVKAELIVSGESLAVVVVRTVGDAKPTYDTSIIDIGHDIDLLPHVLEQTIPFTTKKDWIDTTNTLAICIMRESVENMGARICGLCDNKECALKGSITQACYFK